MKRKLMLLLVFCMCFLVGCRVIVIDDEENSVKNTETQQESEVDTEKNTETQQESEVISEAEKVANMTEEEYKAYCEVIYEDELLERDDLEGKHVKIYGSVYSKGSYIDNSIFGDVIEGVRKKYDLSKRYLLVAAACEERSNVIEGGLIYGDHMYLLFENGKDSAVDEYKQMDDITIYGEVVQCWSGPFVIPRYIEYTIEPVA